MCESFIRGGLLMAGAWGVCLAVGGDSLIGGPLFPEPTPTAPAARLVLAASVGVVVAALVESFTARRERYKPFVLAGIALGCWGAVNLIDSLRTGSSAASAETAVIDFLSRWFPVVAAGVWAIVSIPGVVRAIRRRSWWTEARRWFVAAIVGFAAGYGCYAMDSERGGLIDAVIVSVFGLPLLWGLALIAFSVWIVVRWVWHCRTRRRT
jgi:hypothetical protein